MRSRTNLFVSALVFINMLSGTLLIPAVRPLFAALHPGNDAAMHAFFSINMLGACIGAPLFGLLADRTRGHRQLAALLALADGLLLIPCAAPIPLEWALLLRLFQGAANVGSLSLLMGYQPANEAPAGLSHTSGGFMGARGMAIVLAIAGGAPLGTLMLHWGPQAPFRFAALCGLCVFAAISALPPSAARAAHPGALASLLKNAAFLRLPALWIGVERFTVGCFVITLSLYAHRILGYSDAKVGALFSCFLIPFALATWPLARFGRAFERRELMIGGALVYGLCFLSLGSGQTLLLPLLLAIAGTASAAIYSPSLCLAVSLAPKSLCASAMGLTNAAGTLGMLLGTASAGILTAVLSRHGAAQVDIYLWIFRLAGAAPLATLLVSLPAFSMILPAELRAEVAA